MKKPLSTYTRVMLDCPKYIPQSNQNIFIKMIYHITVEYTIFRTLPLPMIDTVEPYWDEVKKVISIERFVVLFWIVTMHQFLIASNKAIDENRINFVPSIQILIHFSRVNHLVIS